MRTRILLVMAVLVAALAAVPSTTAQIVTPGYRFTASITNDTGSTITDSFVPIVDPVSTGLMDPSSLVSSGFIQADGDDIEITKGPETWYGAAQDLTSTAAVWWARVNNLADGDVRNVDWYMGDPDATVTTVDGGFGLNNVVADNITLTDDATISPADDFYFEIKAQVFDAAQTATQVSFADKSGSYGFKLNDPAVAKEQHVLNPADDVYFRSDLCDTSNVQTATNPVLFGKAGGNEWSSIYRYDNVLVPQGATVTDATMEFIEGATDSNVTVRIQIEMAAADDPTMPAKNNAACAIARTTAHTDWDSIAAFTTGAVHTTPDFTAALQEVFDRPGWAPGQALMVFFEEDGSSTNALRRSGCVGCAGIAEPELHFTYGTVGPKHLYANTYSGGTTESFIYDWDGEPATFRMWFSNSVPMFSLSKDGVWIESDNASTISTIPDGATSIVFQPGRLAYLYSMRLVDGIGLDYTNLVTNPSVESATTGYTAYTATTIAQVTTSPQSGSYALEVVADGLGGTHGAYNTITSTTSAGSAYRSRWACVGTGNWTFRFWDDVGGFYSGDAQALSSTATIFDTNATFNGGSADRRITLGQTDSGAQQTIQCDALQVSTGLGAARTYIDGSVGNNYVWDSTAHASVTHKMEDDSGGTVQLDLDFEPANLTQTDPGDAGDGWTWEGQIADISAAGNTATYLVTQDTTALTSTILAFSINTDNAYQGGSTETTIDIVPTPVAPPNYSVETTGATHILYGFVNLVGTATGFGVTVTWYAVAAFVLALSILITHGLLRQYWVTLTVSTFILVTFMIPGAIAFWVMFPWLVGGVVGGLIEGNRVIT